MVYVDIQGVSVFILTISGIAYILYFKQRTFIQHIDANFA